LRSDTVLSRSDGMIACKWVCLSAILGVGVLRLEAGQVLSLWDEVLSIEARELPEDLRRIDALLADSGLLAPIVRIGTRRRCCRGGRRSGMAGRRSRWPATCG
jgi:hypothetical protein